MNRNKLPVVRVREILAAASKARILVVGDVMLDQFIWGGVSRISPEAPVPVLDFQRESYMPGGAANVARNLTALEVPTELFGSVGKDTAAVELKKLLKAQKVGCGGLVASANRRTTLKTRIVAHQQQVVRIDRETRTDLAKEVTEKLLASIKAQAAKADAIIVGDYGKGVVTQGLLEALKEICHEQGKWLSLDPKPIHKLNLAKLSLITPNRKETFELARLADETRTANPLADKNLMLAAECLLKELQPAVLLITLGELGMLLCQRGQKAIHIPTAAQEVFDVSGAGDTVIATFTLAVAAGASPLEAAVISNHAAGIVVGKVGTATANAGELLESFDENGEE
jgi:rfaE bifunctional protein kinase chain/domain